MPGTFTLNVGQRSVLTPHEFDKDLVEIPGPYPTLTWGTTDPSIELVVDNGLQYAYARSQGFADVTATDTNKSGKQFSDTVSFNVVSGSGEADSVTIEVGPPEPIPA